MNKTNAKRDGKGAVLGLIYLALAIVLMNSAYGLSTSTTLFFDVGCVPSYNYTYSGWWNFTECRANDTIVLHRNITQHDMNSCVSDTIYQEENVTGCIYPYANVTTHLVYDYNEFNDTITALIGCNATHSVSVVNLSLYLTQKDGDVLLLNTSVDGIGNSAIAEWNITMENGNYTVNCLAYSGMGQPSWGTNRTITEVDSPVIVSVDFNPAVAAAGEAVNISTDVVFATNLWAVITLPDMSIETIQLVNDDVVTYNNTGQFGNYSVVVYANNSRGISSQSGSFERFEVINFSMHVDDENGTVVSSELILYAQNGTAVYNSSNGLHNLSIPAGVYDVDVSRDESEMELTVHDINISLVSDPIATMYRLAEPLDGQLVTYGISYSEPVAAGAEVRISYADSAYSNEQYLDMYKCDDWNLSSATCYGTWDNVTSTAHLDTVSKIYSLNVTSLSGFGVKERQIDEPEPPGSSSSSAGGGGGGGGGGGPVKVKPKPKNMVCGEWQECLNGYRNRECIDSNNESYKETERDRCRQVPDDSQGSKTPAVNETGECVGDGCKPEIEPEKELPEVVPEKPETKIETVMGSAIGLFLRSPIGKLVIALLILLLISIVLFVYLHNQYFPVIANVHEERRRELENYLNRRKMEDEMFKKISGSGVLAEMKRLALTLVRILEKLYDIAFMLFDKAVGFIGSFTRQTGDRMEDITARSAVAAIKTMRGDYNKHMIKPVRSVFAGLFGFVAVVFGAVFGLAAKLIKGTAFMMAIVLRSVFRSMKLLIGLPFRIAALIFKASDRKAVDSSKKSPSGAVNDALLKNIFKPVVLIVKSLLAVLLSPFALIMHIKDLFSSISANRREKKILLDSIKVEQDVELAKDASAEESVARIKEASLTKGAVVHRPGTRRSEENSRQIGQLKDIVDKNPIYMDELSHRSLDVERHLGDLLEDHVAKDADEIPRLVDPVSKSKMFRSRADLLRELKHAMAVHHEKKLEDVSMLNSALDRINKELKEDDTDIKSEVKTINKIGKKKRSRSETMKRLKAEMDKEEV